MVVRKPSPWDASTTSRPPEMPPVTVGIAEPPADVLAPNASPPPSSNRWNSSRAPSRLAQHDEGFLGLGDDAHRHLAVDVHRRGAHLELEGRTDLRGGSGNEGPRVVTSAFHVGGDTGKVNVRSSEPAARRRRAGPGPVPRAAHRRRRPPASARRRLPGAAARGSPAGPTPSPSPRAARPVEPGLAPQVDVGEVPDGVGEAGSSRSRRTSVVESGLVASSGSPGC